MISYQGLFKRVRQILLNKQFNFHLDERDILHLLCAARLAFDWIGVWAQCPRSHSSVANIGSECRHADAVVKGNLNQ